MSFSFSSFSIRSRVVRLYYIADRLLLLLPTFCFIIKSYLNHSLKLLCCADDDDSNCPYCDDDDVLALLLKLLARRLTVVDARRRRFEMRKRSSLSFNIITDHRHSEIMMMTTMMKERRARRTTTTIQEEEQKNIRINQSFSLATAFSMNCYYYFSGGAAQIETSFLLERNSRRQRKIGGDRFTREKKLDGVDFYSKSEHSNYEDFSNLDLRGTIWVEAELRNTDFSKSDMVGAVMTRSIMPNARLTCRTFRMCCSITFCCEARNFEDAVAVGANFIRSDMGEMKIKNADFTEAVIEWVPGVRFVETAKG